MSVCGDLTQTDFVTNPSFRGEVYPGMIDEMTDCIGRTVIEAIEL